MDYRLELMAESEFEDLVNSICQDLLGMGMVNFPSGKDGGRDGRFSGKAQKFPSSESNWEGKFIIQSKHSFNPIAKCSDKEFEKIVNDEIPKLIKLKNNHELDNYLLFTNRSFHAISGTKLENLIKTRVGIDNVQIIGKETINKLYLQPNIKLIKQYGLDKYNLPFDFSDVDLRDLVISFRHELDEETENKIREEIDNVKHNYHSISKEDKNLKNNLGKEYYEEIILKSSLYYFEKIKEFLGKPINTEIKNSYYDIVAELNQIITIKRELFGQFEEVLYYITKIITDNNSELKGKNRFVSIFLHYMYFNCDLGKK